MHFKNKMENIPFVLGGSPHNLLLMLKSGCTRLLILMFINNNKFFYTDMTILTTTFKFV